MDRGAWLQLMDCKVGRDRCDLAHDTHLKEAKEEFHSHSWSLPSGLRISLGSSHTVLEEEALVWSFWLRTY